ncbi:MAG: hypothetical protein JWR05_376 [Mucilaginibacter sp.]|nr:hypothetical protein [Mucilaginibacter sp.]
MKTIHTSIEQTTNVIVNSDLIKTDRMISHSEVKNITKNMRDDQNAKAPTMEKPKLKKGKIVDVPNKITVNHMNDALKLANASDTANYIDHIKLYTINSAKDIVKGEFPTLPVKTLITRARFFHAHSGPYYFMLDNDLAVKVSNLIEYAPHEIIPHEFLITAKGLTFLKNVLYRLRKEIDTEIFSS